MDDLRSSQKSMIECPRWGGTRNVRSKSGQAVIVRVAVPDLTCEVTDLYVTGDGLTARLIFRGHFTRTYSGIRRPRRRRTVRCTAFKTIGCGEAYCPNRERRTPTDRPATWGWPSLRHAEDLCHVQSRWRRDGRRVLDLDVAT